MNGIDDGMFGNMFSRLGKGMCRLGINGQMAVKTSNGYKTYDVKTGRLTNVTQFCFDIGEEFFFVVPTTKVKTGDILLIDGKPKCVIENNANKTIKVKDYEIDVPTTKAKTGDIFFVDGKPKCVIENNANKTIKVMDYETSTIQEIVPERHFFMGQMFFYRKIVSMFGSNNFLKKGKGITGMMGMMFKMNMLKSLMGNGGDTNNNNMLTMMMMSNMFGGKDGENDLSEMFDFDFEEADFDPTETETIVETPEEKKARLKADFDPTETETIVETPEEKKARLKAELALLEAEEDKAKN